MSDEIRKRLELIIDKRLWEGSLKGNDISSTYNLSDEDAIRVMSGILERNTLMRKAYIKQRLNGEQGDVARLITTYMTAKPALRNNSRIVSLTSVRCHLRRVGQKFHVREESCWALSKLLVYSMGAGFRFIFTIGYMTPDTISIQWVEHPQTALIVARLVQNDFLVYGVNQPQVIIAGPRTERLKRLDAALRIMARLA